MNKVLEIIIISMAFVGIVLSLLMVFFWVPVEATMGVVQKIFYFHLGAAFSGFFAFFLVFICGILYLATRKERYDIISLSSAEIGVLLITIVLITGVLWAKPIWNVWWTWDPRLTSTFVLWLIFVAYLVLRSNMRESKSMPVYAAVFGIIGFLDVPLVFMSIRWWRTIHPVIIRKASIGLSPEMKQTMFAVIVAEFFMFLSLLIVRMRIESVRRQVDLMKETLELPA